MNEDNHDSDIAAAMGFSSFGGTKKRKYDQSNSPKPAKADASGANSTQLGVRIKNTANKVSENDRSEDEILVDATASQAGIPSKKAQKPAAATGLADFLARAQTLPEKPPNVHQVDHKPSRVDSSASEMASFGGPEISKAELNALKFGVRNENGDVAYFLPNFVGDPWEGMRTGG